MPLTLLDAGSYAQIRAALDLSLDAASLPDTVIQMEIYGPAAEAEVLERDPLTPTYTAGSAAQQRAINAAVYLTAARLAPSLPALTSEKLGDWQMSRKETDLAQLAASLRGLAARELSVNTTGSSTVPLPAFWLACGSRGR